jgi:hypothetical protein
MEKDKMRKRRIEKREKLWKKGNSQSEKVDERLVEKGRKRKVENAIHVINVCRTFPPAHSFANFVNLHC